MNTAAFRRGVRDASPLLLGIAPFGLVTGISATDAGLSVFQALGMSLVVFAGAAQLAALELLNKNAPLGVVVLTAVVINLRMLMYSASIAPYLQAFSARLKAGLAYLLTDQAYALSVSRFRAGDADDRVAYYVGVGGTLWVVWQIATVVGAVAQAGIPEVLALDFTIPLVFLALLIPAAEDGPTTVAAIAGGVFAVVAAGLPLNLGLLVGATVGIAAGLASERALPVEEGDGH